MWVGRIYINHQLVQHGIVCLSNEVNKWRREKVWEQNYLSVYTSETASRRWWTAVSQRKGTETQRREEVERSNGAWRISFQFYWVVEQWFCAPQQGNSRNGILPSKRIRNTNTTKACTRVTVWLHRSWPATRKRSLSFRLATSISISIHELHTAWYMQCKLRSCGKKQHEEQQPRQLTREGACKLRKHDYCMCVLCALPKCCLDGITVHICILQCSGIIAGVFFGQVV